jgi:hypothetical protein
VTAAWCGWPTTPAGRTNTTKYDPDPHAAQVIGDMLRAVPQRADEGLSGALAASGKPLVSNAVTLDQLSANVLEQTRPYLEQVGIRAMVLLPLVADGGYLGYLSMSRHGRIARTPTRRCGWAPTSPRGWR